MQEHDSRVSGHQHKLPGRPRWVTTTTIYPGEVCGPARGARYEGLSRIFRTYGRLGRLSDGPLMDGYRYLQPDNAAGRGRHCHGIMSHDALGDARQPGARADLLRLRH